MSLLSENVGLIPQFIQWLNENGQNIPGWIHRSILSKTFFRLSIFKLQEIKEWYYLLEKNTCLYMMLNIWIPGKEIFQAESLFLVQAHRPKSLDHVP